MKQYQFDIILKQPVIISQQAATVGAHQSLDYISGSALLGLMASRLYSRLLPEDAFLVFHSGKVRFLDALPVHQNQLAYPVPMNLHHFKGETFSEKTQLLADKIFDISVKTDLNNQQPVQLRNFYLTVDGKKISPQKEQTLKTAIDAKQNRAAESQLFGYEALSAGQVFRFAIQFDEDISQELIAKLMQSVQGIAHLGRSRSAQFGRVEIQATQSLYYPKNLSQSITNELTLWLVSDLCLYQHGQATLIPTAEAIGLPAECEWLSKKSFIRTRRYSIYNAYRKHYDKERYVITRGSVLRYRIPDSVDKQALLAFISQGLGLHTETGLGQMIVNPIFMQDKGIVWQATNTIITDDSNQSHDAPKTLLIATLQAKLAKQEGINKVYKDAEDIFKALCQKVLQARQFNALTENMLFGEGQIPSRTQFGRLKEEANKHRQNRQALWDFLTNSENGMLNVMGETNCSGWQLCFDLKVEDNLGTFLKKELEKIKSEKDFPQIVAELAVLGLSERWENCCAGKM